MSTFPRRILPSTIHCLLSKTCEESEFFPSAFEQKIDLEAAYIREEHSSNFVLLFQQESGSIDEFMDLNIHLNFLGDIQL